MDYTDQERQEMIDCLHHVWTDFWLMLNGDLTQEQVEACEQKFLRMGEIVKAKKGRQPNDNRQAHKRDKRVANPL